MKKIIQKLVVLGLLLLIGSVVTVNAQEIKGETGVGVDLANTAFNPLKSRHEIRVGVGYLPPEDYGFSNSLSSLTHSFLSLMDGLLSIFDDDNQSPDEIDYPILIENSRNIELTYNISYKYKINRTFSIGSTFIYRNTQNDLYISDSIYDEGGELVKETKTVVGKLMGHSFTLMIDGYVNYFQTEMIVLYGTLGIGVRIHNDKVVNLSPDKNTLLNDTIYLGGIHICPIGIRFGKKVAGFLELGIGNKGYINGGLAYRF